LTEYDNAQVVSVRDGEPRRTPRIESPLQHVALDNQRPEDASLALALLLRANINQKSRRAHLGLPELLQSLLSADALQLSTRLRQDLVDALRAGRRQQRVHRRPRGLAHDVPQRVLVVQIRAEIRHGRRPQVVLVLRVHDPADELGASEQHRALHVVRGRAAYEERARGGLGGLCGCGDGEEVVVQEQLLSDVCGDLPEEAFVLALRHDQSHADSYALEEITRQFLVM
jgi:hypothetical protein